MQWVEVSAALAVEEAVRLVDELSFAGDAKANFFETAYAGGKCSCVHAGHLRLGR
jgi:hypothetical protein